MGKNICSDSFLFVLLFQNTLQEFGVLQLHLTDDCLYLGHDQLVVLLHLGKSVGYVLPQQFLRQLFELKRYQLDPLVLDVLYEIQP